MHGQRSTGMPGQQYDYSRSGNPTRTFLRASGALLSFDLIDRLA